MPLVMTALQRSVHGVLLGKTARPDWLTHGVPHAAHIDSFVVKMSKGKKKNLLSFCIRHLRCLKIDLSCILDVQKYIQDLSYTL